jgi:hypothetical protein
VEEAGFHLGPSAATQQERDEANSVAWDFESYYQLITNGFHVSPEDFYLDISQDSQTSFNNYFTFLSLRQTSDDAMIDIKDKSGTKHQVTFGRYKQIMLAPGGYGDTCLSLTF